MFENMERKCKGPCGEVFPVTKEFFFFRKSSRNGKHYPSSYCKSCEREKAATSRRNRYKTKEGKAAIDAQTKAYRSKPDKAQAISDHLKNRYANDFEYREERKRNARSWRQNNPEKKRAANAAWFQKNKARLREEWNERYRTDPAFRLRNNLRRAIHEALRVGGGDKAGRSILQHLPYSMEELRLHLEALWEPWMNWDNYGVLESDRRTWQIDHVIPQAQLLFDDFSHPNFLKCWRLSNLRPVESQFNLEKGCKV